MRIALGGMSACAFGLLLYFEVADLRQPIAMAELLQEAFEIFLIIVAASGTTLFFSRMLADHKEKATLREELAFAHAEGQAWRAKAQRQMKNIDEAIREQFAEWELSPAEVDVAMFMLKGFSHKEISEFRNVSESTIRQQGAVIYAKSNLKSRQAFCAFFMEDLLQDRPN